MNIRQRTSPTRATTTRFWYVIECKSHQEDKVHTLLKSRGIETFYPTIPVQRVNPRAARFQPYFPGYLFVRVDLTETGISTLEWLPGALGLVQFGDQPAPVPDTVILRLRQQLGRFKTPDARRRPIQTGDHVRPTGGMSAGYEAIFDARLDGAARVRVLLSLLARSARTTVNPVKPAH